MSEPTSSPSQVEPDEPMHLEVEADEADRLEQSRDVALDEEEYR